MKKSIVTLVLSAGIALFLGAVQADEPLDLTIEPNPLIEGYDLSWWGELGFTYFPQHSTDLTIWEYCPDIWVGEDELQGIEITTSASRSFFRLRISDYPTADPMLTDFDSDGVSTFDELSVGTDPLESSDVNGNGIPDDWEFFFAGYVPPALPEIAGPDLVGHWRFDDLSGTALALDSSQYGRGALISAPSQFNQSGGFLSGALEFTSTGDSVAVPFSAWDGREDVSFSLWLKTSQTGEMTIVSASNTSSADEFKVTIQDSRTRIWLGASSSPLVDVSGHLSLADSVWHHLVVVCDGDLVPAGTEKITLYLDGSEIVAADELTIGPLSIDRKKLVLGQDVDAGGVLSGSKVFSGWLDDVRFYNKAVSAAEVSVLYNVDSDGDLLPDHWELIHFGDLSLDGDSDPDFDGLSNADELALGEAYDPNRDDLHLNTLDNPFTPFVNEGHTVNGLLRHFSFDSFSTNGGGFPEFPDISAPVGLGAGRKAVWNSSLVSPAGSGLFGNGLAFTAGLNISDALVLDSPANFSALGEFTVSTWFKANDRIIANSTFLSFSTENKPRLFNWTLLDERTSSLKYTDSTNYYVTSVEWTHAPVSTEWHHFSMVVIEDEELDSVSLYIDGQLVGEHKIDIAPLTLGALDGVMIGQGQEYAGSALSPNTLTGRNFDEFRVYSRALAPVELNALSRYDANKDGLPDHWQNSVVENVFDNGSPVFANIAAVGLTVAHPSYPGLTMADVFARNLDPAGGDSVNIEKIKAAWEERYGLLQTRHSLLVPGDENKWGDISLTSPNSLSSSLTLLNRVSFEIDQFKGEFLNVDSRVFEKGNLMAELTVFNDDSLPPIGRVTLQNFQVKIPQIVAALKKLRFVQWPTLPTFLPTDKPYILDAEKDQEDDPWFLKPDESYQDSYAGSSNALTHVARLSWEKSSYPTFAISDDIENVQFSGLNVPVRYAVLERAKWSPYSIKPFHGPLIDFNAAYRTGTQGAISSGVATVELTQMNEMTVGHLNFLGFNTKVKGDVVEGEFVPSYFAYDGTLNIPQPSGLTEEVVRRKFGGAGENIEVERIPGEVEFEVTTVIEAEFATKLPDARNAVLPSLTTAALGDVTVGTGRNKMSVNLGYGLTKTDHMASLEIVVDRPPSAFTEKWSHNALGYHTTLQFAGERTDFDFVYDEECTFANPGPMVYYDTFNPASEEAWDDYLHAVKHATQPPLLQVRGGQVFANIIYNAPNGYRIDLYWSSKMGKRSIGEKYAVPGGAFIRSIVVNGVGNSLTVTTSGRTHTLSASGTAASQTWTVNTDAGEDSIEERAIYAGIPDTSTLTYTLERNDVQVANRIVEYEAGQSPLEWNAVVKSVQLPDDARPRSLTFIYDGDKVVREEWIDPRSKPVARYVGDFFRLRTVTYGGEFWELDGMSDTFAGDWGELEKSKRKLAAGQESQEAHESLTTYAESGITTELGAEGSRTVISKTLLKYADDLSSITSQPGIDLIPEEETVVYFSSYGDFPWAVSKVLEPAGIESTTTRAYNSKSGVSTIRSNSAETYTSSKIDRYGVLEESVTKKYGLTVAKATVGEKHVSGQPLSYSHLRDDTEETFQYHPSGDLSIHTQPGGAFEMFTYNLLGEVASSTDSSTGTKTTIEYNPEGSLGIKVSSERGSDEIEIRKEIYDIHGELLSGEYGRKKRPISLVVADSVAGVQRQYQWSWGSGAGVNEDYGFGGVLLGRHGASVFPETSQTLAAASGGGLLLKSTVDGNTDMTSEKVILPDGRVSVLKVPSAENPGSLVEWGFSYPVPVNGKRTVEVIDPDDVEYAQSIAWSGSSWSHESGLKGILPQTVETGVASGSLVSVSAFGGSTLSTSSYDPATGLSTVSRNGLASQTYTMQPGITGGSGSVRITGPGGIKGQVNYEDGLYESSSISLPSEAAGQGRDSYEHKIDARWPDFTVKESSGTASGVAYSATFREGDGVLETADVGGTHYAITATEEAGALYDVEIENTTKNTSTSIHQTSKEGDVSVSGDDLVPFEIDRGIASNEITESITTQPGTADAATTVTKANAAAAVVSKKYQGDATPGHTFTSTPGGRPKTYSNRRGQTLTNTYTAPAAGMLPTGGTWTNVSGDAHPGNVTLGYPALVGGVQSPLSSSITDLSGQRALTRDGQHRVISSVWSNGGAGADDLDGLTVTNPVDEDGLPDYLQILWGSSLSELQWTAQTAQVELDAGTLSVPTGKPATIAIASGANSGAGWEYNHNPVGSTSPGHDGVGTITIKDTGGNVKLTSEFEYFPDPGSEGTAGHAGKLLRRTNAFTALGGSVSHIHAYGAVGKRESTTISATGGAALSLSQFASGNVWSYGYSTGSAPSEVYTGRLQSATLRNAGNTVLANYQYTYNGAGVRTSDTKNSTLTKYATNKINQIAGIDLNNDNDALDTGETAFTYDLDGNRTADGTFTYTWDALNRLRSVTSVATSEVIAEYEYDAEGRRFRKKLYNETTGAHTQTILFAYDGWNLVFERTLNASDTVTRERKFHWGLDLSNTPQGAGGIGGLTLIEDKVGTTTTLSIPVYDGHGNIIALADGVTGAVVAQYATGPYGEPLATSGDRQDDCPFRFSTKYLDEETGLYYYGYRYYEPTTGSWMSRDPLGEEGGLNLYGFVENDPVNAWDYLGLTAGRKSWEGDRGVKIYSNYEVLFNEIDLRGIFNELPQATQEAMLQADWPNFGFWEALGGIGQGKTIQVPVIGAVTKSSDSTLNPQWKTASALNPLVYLKGALKGLMNAATGGKMYPPGGTPESRLLAIANDPESLMNPARWVWDGGPEGTGGVLLAVLPSLKGNFRKPATYSRFINTRTRLAQWGTKLSSEERHFLAYLEKEYATDSGFLNMAPGRTLAPILEGHGTGQGFTGVFDSATGKVSIKPSTAEVSIPQGWVRRAGGHADVSAALGGDAAGHSGFAVILQENGSLNITWRSGTLNRTPGSLVPEAQRQAIIDAIKAETGRTVNH